ncbi:MAG: serine hydrolase [Lachnospiraceae bacterium]|nr:serine hydrolase [Lachnospiraceae bacterium]
MKCIKNKKLYAAFSLLSVLTVLTSCTASDTELPYGSMENNQSFTLNPVDEYDTLPLFAEDIAAVSDNVIPVSLSEEDAVFSAAIYNEDDAEVLYSLNAVERTSPASLTKLMTALIVFEKYGDRLDDVITIGEVSIKEEGVQRFGLKAGDRITIRQLLEITLIQSGNDAALALAQYAGDSTAGSRLEEDGEITGEERFVQLMNERAESLGCTGTHFVNPHGLDSAEHYSTAYDQYLIFRQLIAYPEFLEMINTPSVQISYNAADGTVKTKTIMNTDMFINGGKNTPEGITVIGGKTGSTSSAGKCLILLADNASGKSFIAVVMGAKDEGTLYNTLSELLKIADS